MPAVVYSGAPFFGIMDRDFKQLSSIIQNLDDSIYCDNINCFGKNDCSYYSDITPDYKFTIGKLNNYTLAGETLFEHPGLNGGCQLALYNSGEQYVLGEFFLQNYYSVYDVLNGKIGLGKVIDLHPKLPDPVKSLQPDEGDYKLPEGMSSKVFGAFAIFIGVMCICAAVCAYKRTKPKARRDLSALEAFEEHFSNDESDTSSNSNSYEDPNILLDSHNQIARVIFDEETAKAHEGDGIHIN